MAGKLGADFDTTQPSDTDLVKKGAAWIRDIKSRIFSFVSTLFNPETGQFKDKVIPSAALVAIPGVEGTWNEVDVNSKGLVIAGRTISKTVFLKQYVFSFGRAGMQATTGDTATPVLALHDPEPTSSASLNTATYSFTVPPTVTRLFVRVQAAGGGPNGTSPTFRGGGGSAVEAVVDCLPDDQFLVWVGIGGIYDTTISAGLAGGPSKFEFDSTQSVKAGGGHPAAIVAGNGGAGFVTGDRILNYALFDGQTGSATLGGSGGFGMPGYGAELMDGFVTVTYYAE